MAELEGEMKSLAGRQAGLSGCLQELATAYECVNGSKTENSKGIDSLDEV